MSAGGVEKWRIPRGKRNNTCKLRQRKRVSNSRVLSGLKCQDSSSGSATYRARRQPPTHNVRFEIGVSVSDLNSHQLRNTGGSRSCKMKSKTAAANQHTEPNTALKASTNFLAGAVGELR